jgi:hypothetical protein
MLAEQTIRTLRDESQRAVCVHDLVRHIERITGLVARHQPAEIFISYRRVDSQGPAGQLYRDLRAHFGQHAVFMDVRSTGIPWGADWDTTLNDALNSCRAMVVVIGPLWATCERVPGQRRLDSPDDWVCTEIAAGLKGTKLVLPVLVRDARFPATAEVPEALRALGFGRQQGYPVSDAHWEDDIARLVQTLCTLPELKELHDFETSETGIRLLAALVNSDPVVAQVVARSRAAIEATDREVGELTLLKGIHDALHAIDAECLQSVRSTSVAAAHRQFGNQDRAIRRMLQELRSVSAYVPELLQTDLPNRLSAVASAFDEADAPAARPEARDMLLDTLEHLVGPMLADVNGFIDRAATHIELETLAALTTRVANLMPDRARSDRELKDLYRSRVALESVAQELKRRVHEHDLLQTLDNALRQALAGHTGDEESADAAPMPPSRLLVNWKRVRSLRKALKPVSADTAGALAQVESLERDIDDVVEGRNTVEALSLLRAYFQEMGHLFRDVDTALKEFCKRLREHTQRLESILARCSTVEVSHAF